MSLFSEKGQIKLSIYLQKLQNATVNKVYTEIKHINSQTNQNTTY